MFAGTHQLTIDEKGRIAVPARFRAELADICNSQVVITCGPLPCIEIYPAPEFQRIAQDIQDMTDRRNADLLKQVFIGFAVETEVDKQGRVLLPTMLRKRARLNGSAILMGQYARFDLWAEDVWNEKFGEGPGSMLASLHDAFLTLKR